MTNEPLGLPRGSIRAIIVLMMVLATFVIYFYKDIEVLTMLLPVTTILIGWYLGARSVETKDSPRPEKLPKAEDLETRR